MVKVVVIVRPGPPKIHCIAGTIAGRCVGVRWANGTGGYRCGTCCWRA